MAGRPTLRQSVPKLGQILRRFAPEVRAERALIGGSMLALLLESAFRLLEPWPLKYVLDAVIVTQPGAGEAQGWLGSLDDTTLLALCGAAVLAFSVLRALAAYLSTVGLALAGNRVLTTVRGRLYAHLQRLSLSYHARARTGDLVARVTADIGRLQEVSVTAVMPLVANLMTLVGMCVVMLLLNWKLALVVVALIPIFGVALRRRGGRIRGAARRQRSQEGAMAASAAESMSAIKVVQAYTLEETLDRSFASQNQASLTEGVQTKRLSAGLERWTDVLTGVGTAAVLWYGARLVLAGEISPGDLVVFFLYLKIALKPLRDMAKYSARLAAAAAAGERVLDVLDTEPEIHDRPDAVSVSSVRGHVRFENVSLSYEADRPVLHGVDLELRPGEHVALVGPSGGGKSTLASLVLRLYEPDAGRVLIDGRDLRDYTVESLRRQTAIVLQESVLFAVSVRQNIAYGGPELDDAEIEAAARLAGAHEFIERLPEGYDTVLGERGATLSGGQRQRIAIARAAARRASIVVLDEATTGLDEENERAVTDALRRLTAERTTFLIAHHLPSVRHADTILYLQEGRIIERGTHAELIERGGSYAAVYALQEAARGDGHHPAAVVEPVG